MHYFLCSCLAIDVYWQFQKWNTASNTSFLLWHFLRVWNRRNAHRCQGYWCTNKIEISKGLQRRSSTVFHIRIRRHRHSRYFCFTLLEIWLFKIIRYCKDLILSEKRIKRWRREPNGIFGKIGNRLQQTLLHSSSCRISHRHHRHNRCNVGIRPWPTSPLVPCPWMHTYRFGHRRGQGWVFFALGVLRRRIHHTTRWGWRWRKERTVIEIR